MKKYICILTGVLLFIGCKKKEDNSYVPGKIVAEISYKGPSSKQNTKGTKLDSLYSGFGDYVTSITPTKTSAKFRTIRYEMDTTSHNTIELIDNNWGPYDSRKYADFSNHSSVSMVPTLYGDLANEGASFQYQILFTFMTMDIVNIYHEIQLPSQYSGIDTLTQFLYNQAQNNDEDHSYSTLSNNILNTRLRMLLYPIFGGPQNVPTGIVFGGTNSSYLLNIYTDPHDYPVNASTSGNYMIRSSKYTPITFIPPDNPEKTTYIKATMSFDYDNLIQIYAGQDNIPYTKDDVFLYEPNFFERFDINVIIE